MNAKLNCLYYPCDVHNRLVENNYDDAMDQMQEQCTTLLHKDCSTFRKLQGNTRKHVYEIYGLGKKSKFKNK